MFLRIITGIIGIALATFVIQYGGAPFACFAMFLSLLAWHEYSAAFRRAGVITTYIFGSLALILLLCCAWLGNVEELLAVLTVSMMLIFFAKRIVRVPNPVYVWRLTKKSVMRRERTPQETLNFWLNPIIFGIKTLDKFMNRIEFFRRNVQYRCAVLEFFVHTKTAQVFESSLNLSLPEIFSAVESEFGKSLGEQDVLISWLLTDLITQQKIFAQIKNT